MLVLLAGLPGVGKSTLAQALARARGALVLDKDRIRDSIFPASEVDFSNPQNALATEVMLMVAAYILERDPTKLVVLDGKPFSREVQREETRRLTERVATPFRLVHCVAPDEVVQGRLEAVAANDPRNLVADRTFAKYQRIKGAFEPITGPHLVINTSKALGCQLDACLRYLDEPDGER